MTSGPNSRRLLLGQYLLSSALASTGMVAAVHISAIAAQDMLESPTWTGLPMAASILGTALGAQIIGRTLERYPLRTALAGQYGIALGGGALAFGAVIWGNLWLLALGLAGLGLGHGVTQYVRYLAADLFVPARRPVVLSWVVWMGGLGAVLGPTLLAPAGQLAIRASLPEVAGPYLLAVVAFAVCAFCYGVLFPKQLFADPEALSAGATTQPAGEPRATAAWPIGAKLALVAMIVGHMVMVFVMTMTPIHLSHHGHGLGAIGWVLSAHMAGMYLSAPAVGYLCARSGSAKVLIGGCGLLVLACLLAAANAGALGAEAARVPMSLPLFLLGLGWSFGFVGGSTLLNHSLPPSLRLRGRAFADACVWTAAALSSLLSSVLFAYIGFAQLSWLGLALAAMLGLLLVVRHSDLAVGEVA